MKRTPNPVDKALRLFDKTHEATRSASYYANEILDIVDALYLENLRLKELLKVKHNAKI